MSVLTKTAKENILNAMYKSVDRMNRHTQDGNEEGVACERGLQINLRRNLEEINQREKNSGK